MSKSEIPNTEIWLNSLSGEHWNRTTIADGKWLNKNTIQPLFENDCILASAVHDTSAALIATSAYFEDRVDVIQGEIDVINAGSDVIDVLGAHSALNTYSGWTTYNDVIKILNDETHSGEQTYYRYTAGDPESGTIHPDPSGWEFVGELAPYYSKTESNAMSAYLYNYTTTASGDLYDKIFTSATNLQKDVDYVSGQADYSAAYLYHVIESTSGKMEVVGGRYVEVLNETHPDGMVTYSADLYADKIVDLAVDGHLDISTQGNTSTITCDASKIIFGSGSAPEDIKLTTITDVGTQTSGSSNVILGVIPKEPGGTYSQKAFVTNKVNGTQSYGWQEMSGFVRGDLDQTALLTSAEQAQARANIGAAAASEAGKTVYLDWDGTANIFNDIADIVAAGNVPTLRCNGYDWLCVDSTNDNRFVFCAQLGEGSVVAFAQFFVSQNPYITYKNYSPSFTASDANKIYNVNNAGDGTRWSSLYDLAYNSKSVPVVMYPPTSSDVNASKKNRAAICRLDKNHSDDGIHTDNYCEFIIHLNTGATANGNANSSLSLHVLVNALEDGGPYQVDMRVTGNNNWDLINARPTIALADTGSGNDGVIVFFGLFNSADTAWVDFEQTTMTVVVMNPVPVLLGNTDKVNSLSGLTIHRLSPDNIPPVSYGSPYECLCIDSNGALEWGKRVRGGIYLDDGQGGYTSLGLDYLRLNLTEGMKGLVRARPEGGSIEIAGWLVPEAPAFTEDQGYYPTYVSVGTSFGLKWKLNPADLQLLTAETITALYPPDVLTVNVVDGNYYNIKVPTGTSCHVWLATDSIDTIHTIIRVYSPNATTFMGSQRITIHYYDECLIEHTSCIDLKNTSAVYSFDVYLKKVTKNNQAYTICRVYDYPCIYRPSPEQTVTDNITNVSSVGMC